MSLWFARFAELPAGGGYFYLCPRCYGRLIEPHAEEIIQRLVEQHPFLHSRTPVRHYQAEGPGAAEAAVRRPGASPAEVPDTPAGPGPLESAPPRRGQFPLAE